MDWLIGFDWGKVFRPEMPLLEIFVRGTVMYLGIFVLLRTLLRREVGMLTVPDILMFVLLADAAQNGMAGDYRTVTDGLLVVGVIVSWNLLLDRLAFYFPRVERFVHPPPLPVVSNGRLVRANLRREYISPAELWSELRAQGIDDLAQVKAAYIEANGTVTVIRRDDGAGPRRRRRPV